MRGRLQPTASRLYRLLIEKQHGASQLRAALAAERGAAGTAEVATCGLRAQAAAGGGAAGALAAAAAAQPPLGLLLLGRQQLWPAAAASSALLHHARLFHAAGVRWQQVQPGTAGQPQGPPIPPPLPPKQQQAPGAEPKPAPPSLPDAGGPALRLRLPQWQLGGVLAAGAARRGIMGPGCRWPSCAWSCAPISTCRGMLEPSRTFSRGDGCF